MEDDVDIYDDLPVLNIGESICKIDEERQHLKLQLEKKESDLISSKERIEILEKENRTLEQNISSLYKTAVNEIKRKDQVIEELRREKDIIIFRRTRKQHWSNDSTPNVFADDLGCSNNENNQVNWPHKLIPVTLNEEMVHPVKSGSPFTALINSKLSEHTSKNKDHSDSNSDKVVSSQISSESVHRNLNINVSNFLEDIISHKECGAAVLSFSTSDNSQTKIDDGLSDKLSSSSSHPPYHDPDWRNRSREESHRSISKERREKLSLNSESKREERHKQSSSCSQQHFDTRERPRSPRRCSSSKVHSKRRRREEKVRDYRDNKNYHRNLYKESADRRYFSVDSRNNYRDKNVLHSEKSPSPKQQRRHNGSLSLRYCDKTRFGSLVKSYIKPQSDNMRVASQLKSKYSRTVCERSVSCSPVKQKAGKSTQNSKVSDTSHVSIRKSDLEGKNIYSIKKINRENSKNNGSLHENFVKRLHNVCVTDAVVTDVCWETSADNSRHVKNSVNEKHSGCTHVKSFCETNCALSENVCVGLVSDLKRSAVHDKKGKSDSVLHKRCELFAKNGDKSKNKVSNTSKTKIGSTVTETSHHARGSEYINERNSEDGSIDHEIGSLPKSQSNSELNRHDQTENQRKSFLKSTEHLFKKSNMERNQHEGEVMSTILLRTPPSKHLIPLKISPSYEDPAVVNVDKFSFCVFNEQCDFKRHKRKRSVKLVVTDTKNNNCIKMKDNDCDESHSATNIDTENTSVKHSDSSSGIKNNISVLGNDPGCNDTSSGELKCVKLKELTIVHEKNNETILNVSVDSETCDEQIDKLDSGNSTGVSKNTISVKGPHRSVSLSFNAVHVSRNQSNDSPSKKRKVDSICEELKANLEKKNFVRNTKEVQLTDKHENLPFHCEQTGTGTSSKECQKTSDVEATVQKVVECRNTTNQSVKVVPPIKRTVVSRLRRRVHNLQDSVVQVLSQVKSKISQ